MAIRGSIKEDHIPLNKFKLKVTGLPNLTFTKIGGLEEELETVTLPDRTTATGGNTKAIEFDAELPLHHTVEVAAIEAWWKECRDPVSPTYKKAGTLIQESGSGQIRRTWALTGLYPKKRATPDLDIENEGEMAVLALSFVADTMDPV